MQFIGQSQLRGSGVGAPAKIDGWWFLLLVTPTAIWLTVFVLFPHLPLMLPLLDALRQGCGEFLSFMPACDDEPFTRNGRQLDAEFLRASYAVTVVAGGIGLALAVALGLIVPVGDRSLVPVVRRGSMLILLFAVLMVAFAIFRLPVPEFRSPAISYTSIVMCSILGLAAALVYGRVLSSRARG